jgi:hypothetical protein
VFVCPIQTALLVFATNYHRLVNLPAYQLRLMELSMTAVLASTIQTVNQGFAQGMVHLMEYANPHVLLPN